MMKRVTRSKRGYQRPGRAWVWSILVIAALLIGGFSRFGVWKQIVGAIFLLVALKLIEGFVTDPVLADPGLWPLLYVPPLFGFAVSALMLWWAARPHRPVRMRTRRAEA